MKVCVLATQLCPTLYDPMGCSPPVSSVHGIFQARILEWIAILLQGIFPTQESNPHLLCLLHWQVGSLPPAPSGKPSSWGPELVGKAKGTGAEVAVTVQGLGLDCLGWNPSSTTD